MNTLMLALAVRLGGGQIRPARLLAGAGAGAAAALGARGLALSRGEQMLLCLPLAMLMMRIARGRKGRIVRQGMLLLCAAGFTGGIVLALEGATRSSVMAYVLAVAAASGIGACAVRERRAAGDVLRARVRIAHRGRCAEFDAMIDSGNTLRDYLTHLPVIVLPQSAAEKRLHMGNAPLRPIFAQTAAGKQRLGVFSPQEIELECHGTHRRALAVVALSPQMSADVPALVPAALLDEQGN